MSAHGNASDALAIGYFDLVAPQPVIDRVVQVVVSSEDGGTQGDVFTFAGSGFQPSEPVSLWLTRPDGSVRDLEIVKAGDGTFSYGFVPGTEEPAGTYHVTAFGRSSERTGIAAFDVVRDDDLADAATATLEVFPTQAEQLEVVTLTGHGFEAGEVVGLWLTLPDGRVMSLYEGVTLTGSFQEQIYVPSVTPEDGLPEGVTDFSAYGKKSGRRAITSLEVFPGNGFRLVQ